MFHFNSAGKALQNSCKPFPTTSHALPLLRACVLVDFSASPGRFSNYPPAPPRYNTNPIMPTSTVSHQDHRYWPLLYFSATMLMLLLCAGSSCPSFSSDHWHHLPSTTSPTLGSHLQALPQLHDHAKRRYKPSVDLEIL